MRHPRKGTHKLAADPARTIVAGRKKRTRRKRANALAEVLINMTGGGR